MDSIFSAEMRGFGGAGIRAGGGGKGSTRFFRLKCGLMETGIFFPPGKLLDYWLKRGGEGGRVLHGREFNGSC